MGLPRFFLASTPGPGEPELTAEDQRHGLRVLRLGSGDEVIGLDGRGSAWPLRVTAATRRELRVELAGEVQHQPEPGARGAALPWLEVAVAWPKGKRADAMVAQLTALGVAAISPLVASWSGPQGPADADRARRVAREACKQSRRLWLPRLGDPLPLERLAGTPAGAALAVLDPRAPTPFLDWAAGAGRQPRVGTRERPLALAIGPEGGFASGELEALVAAGATPTRLGPHVLRIELAAVAAAAVAVAALERTREGPLPRPGQAL